jgi:Fis family transcriptional regulator, factor for inversion stimulation protein
MTRVQKKRKRKLKRLLKNVSIEKLISLKIEGYFKKVKELKEDNLYPHVIAATERALIKSVLEKTAYNQIKTSAILGINRNTLRKKIEDLKIKLV